MLLNNRYELGKELGRGAFATVHLAHDQKLNRPVAVKLLHPFLVEAGGQTVVNQFLQEAHAMARLSHSHVAHLYDLGQQGSRLFLVMEYLPGGDLAQQMADRGRYTVAATLSRLRPIAAALEMAHAAGAVHRDVKPANILFRADGAPVLTDFGLVKFVQLSMNMSQYQPTQGQTLGTPGYKAPEQINELLGPISPATDTFALAVVAYQMLAGQPPFVGSSADALNYQTVHADRAQVAQRLPTKLPPAVRQALLAALQVEPASRPVSPLDWLKTWSSGIAPTPSLARQSASASSPPDNPAGIEWVEIPAGDFLYGENKQKTKIAKPYRIGKYPVTNAQYKRFIDANPQQPVPNHWDTQARAYPPSLENHPVAYVNLDDAQAFCHWAGCRLPRELEWEKAARGTKGFVYPWGNEWLDGVCNVKSSGTTPVDTYPEGISPYGVWDMSGNVWEWTTEGVLRGGSWDSVMWSVRSSNRVWDSPDRRYDVVGFRCASSAP